MTFISHHLFKGYLRVTEKNVIRSQSIKNTPFGIKALSSGKKNSRKQLASEGVSLPLRVHYELNIFTVMN